MLIVPCTIAVFKGQDPITTAYVAPNKQVEKGGLDHADKAVGRRPHPLFFEKRTRQVVASFDTGGSRDPHEGSVNFPHRDYCRKPEPANPLAPRPGGMLSEEARTVGSFPLPLKCSVPFKPARLVLGKIQTIRQS